MKKNLRISAKVQGDNKATIKYWHFGKYIGCTVLLANGTLWKDPELALFCFRNGLLRYKL